MDGAPAVDLLASQDFESALRRESGYVLVACLRRAPDTVAQEASLQKIAWQFEGIVKVWVLDAHEHDSFHVKYRIMGTPTYLLLEDGVELDRTFGKLSSESLAEFLSKTVEKN